MYRITCDGQIIFDTRLDDYVVFDPVVNVGTNTVGECAFKVYSTHPHFNDMHLLKSIFEVSDENSVIFRGRMTNNTRDFYNGKAVDLEGVMAFFNDSMVKPFVFPDDFAGATNSDNIVEYFLRWLIHQHNQQVEPHQQFKLGNVNVYDPNNYISRSSENIISTWEALKGKLFESSLGGFLCIRYEEDGNYIDYLADFEDVNTQEIRLGQNMLDIKHEMDATTTYSAIIPIGAEIDVESEGEIVKKKLTLESIADGKLNNTDDTYKITLDNGLHAIYSESAVENYGWICCAVTWDDVTEASNLKNKAREYLLGIAGFCSDIIEVTAADLHFSDEEIRSFRIYKKVKVISKPHSISATYNLTKLSIDLVNPQNTKIVVGTTKDTLTDSISKGGGSGSVGGSSGGGAIVNASSIISALGYTPADKNNVPTRVSDLTNDKGYLEEETDPTVPAWAKQTSKPTYNAEEVGADPKGTAETKVSNHNTNKEAHNDIRLLIEELTTRLNTLADSDDTTLDQMSELVAYIKSNRSLIEEVTTNKINVSDIIDNLTTNVSNKPLSAAQGVALKSLIDELSKAKADKATTLAGYGITDGATKEELNAVQSSLASHTSDKVSHITAEERAAWNNKADIEDIPTKYSDLEDDIGYVKQKDFEGHKHIWTDIADRPFSSKVVDVPLFEDEFISSATIPVVGMWYRHNLTKRIDVDFYDHINYKLVVNNVAYTEHEMIGGALAFSDVTIGARTVQVRVTGSQIMFLDVGDYGDYELVVSLYAVAHKIEKMHLPDDIGTVRTVNYIAPDANGNVNIEGSGTNDNAFEIKGGDTMMWSGNTTGKIVVNDPSYDENFTYVRVSDAIPTLADFQKGFTVVWNYGDAYECTANDVQEVGNYIRVDYTSCFVIKEDDTTFTEEGITINFPKKGTYFMHYTEGSNKQFVSQLTINNYLGFTKTLLREECMPVHKHDWYGKIEKSGNTVLSDDVVHGGYVKVSDSVPTEEELRKGGVIRHYAVENNQLSGDFIVGDYLGESYGITVRDEAIAITYGLEILAIISINGSPTIGAVTIDAITEPGVYFVQNEYSCVHSLTINEFAGFNNNIEKVPIELLPKDYIEQLVKEVIGSMNILITKEE